MTNSNKLKWQIASSVRVIPYVDEHPDEAFYLVVNVANKRWLKITTQAYQFLRECSADRALAEVMAETSRRFAVEEEELVVLHDQFVKQGFLVEPGVEQEEVCRGACTTEGRAIVYLNVTDRCNLKCPTCYFDAGPGGKDPLSTSEINRITGNLAANGVTEVVISGGEPLIRQDIFEILQHARPLFKKIYLLTNGVVLAKHGLCERLVGLVDRVQVSVDGSRPEVHEHIRGKGTFTPTIQAIKNLNEAGIPEVTISLTLTRLNAHDTLNVMELASELGVRFNFSRFTPIGRGYRNRSTLALTAQQALDLFRSIQERTLETGRIRLDPLYRQLGQPIRLKCSAGETSFFSIAPDGSVYPCHVLHQPRFYIGNALYERDLRTMIRNSEVAQRFRELKVDSRPKCKECFVRYFCGGGCPANSYAVHGDIRAPDPFCPFYYKFELAIITGWRYDLSPVANVKRVIERLR